MREGETQLDRKPGAEADVDLDVEGVTALDDETSESESPGLGSRLRARAGRFVSSRALVFALIFSLVGALAVGSVLPFGIVGNLVGIFVAAFAYGTATSTRRYVELGLAGGVLGGGMALLGNLALSLLGPGVPLVAVGFVAGALAGGLGHYFGRDLRDGLTRDL